MKRFFLSILFLAVCPVQFSIASSCEKSFSAAFNDVSPLVVRVVAISIDPYSALCRVNRCIGSGLVIDYEGHVLTNAHVVYGSAQVLVSYVDEGPLLEAEIIGMDLISDLAVIRIPPNSALPEMKFAKKWSYAVGDQVMAIGYPLGIGKTASSGIVSALERVIPLSTFSWMMPYIQTDTPINPGNSGGPLVNLCGEIIGINTLHLINGQNINFAIPVGLIEELVPQLIDAGHVSRPWYGIYGQIISFPMAMSLNISPGFLVETIEPGSPAEKIGLRGGTYPARFGFREFLLGGDVLTSVNGVSLDDLETVAEVVRSFNVGDCVEVEYWRNGKTAKVEVLLPERPELPGDARWLFSRHADK